MTITAAGLVVIGLTGTGADTSRPASLAALIAVEGAIFALGAGLVRVSTRRHVLDRPEGLLLGAAAGALFGVSDVAIRYLTQAPLGPLLGAVSPWTLTALTARVIAFYAPARSLQLGEVRALTAVAANLAAIVGGTLVFHEPIGSGPLATTARLLAFCLVIAGAALMPAPTRATPTRPNTRATRPTDNIPTHHADADPRTAPPISSALMWPRPCARSTRARSTCLGAAASRLTAAGRVTMPRIHGWLAGVRGRSGQRPRAGGSAPGR